MVCRVHEDPVAGLIGLGQDLEIELQVSGDQPGEAFRVLGW